MGVLESFLRRRIPGGPVYVRIRRRELWVRDTGERTEWRDLALVAVDNDSGAVLACGSEAKEKSRELHSTTSLVWPFDHPRTLLNDFALSEKLLQHALHTLHSGSWLRPAPVILMHPLELLDGGLTMVERRALRELAAGAGSRKPLVWEGRELVDAEVGLERFTIAA